MKIPALCLLPLVLILSTASCGFAAVEAGTQDKSPTYTIGNIYYFGYAGIDIKPLQARLADHIGKVLQEKDFDGEQEAIQKAVGETTGKTATDVNMVCCDADQRLALYVGLSGASSHPFPARRSPAGNDHLDDVALKLYSSYETAIAKAVANGNSGEDDSLGYALTDDPEARRIELAMRAYALERGPQLETVLLHAAEVKQRRASSALLGYAQRSNRQIKTLTEAVGDPDSEVRNNATRALAVLATAKDANTLRVDPKVFIELLSSGHWTDRNKGSFLLERLSRHRDHALLSHLHDNALQSLIEGAGWDFGHSYPFLSMLGRMGNIPEDQLNKLIGAGDTTTIIHAAEQRP